MSEPLLPREVRRRLAMIQHAEEVTGNVAMTCRYYGISRTVYYRWLGRYREQGVDGLRDLSRRPRHSPNATHVDVVGKILYLRQNYHFGPAKIAMYLKRYHDVEVSPSGVWRILKRLDLNRLPASQRYKRLDKRWQRYEKQLPGHQVQIDVKFVEPLSPRPGPPSVGAQVLPVHRDRRLHPVTCAAHLPALRPENRDPVRRLRNRAAALPGADHPDRQWR
jgi:transposase